MQLELGTSQQNQQLSRMGNMSLLLHEAEFHLTERGK